MSKNFYELSSRELASASLYASMQFSTVVHCSHQLGQCDVRAPASVGVGAALSGMIHNHDATIAAPAMLLTNSSDPSELSLLERVEQLQADMIKVTQELLHPAAKHSVCSVELHIATL